ncbi:MAG: response regulator [Halobacteriovoraceae bacterium]|nr:response regulator [Halobacteriovoraceae bacterium]
MEWDQFSVLVVDDEEALAEICGEVFEMEGFNTKVVNGGPDALKIINETKIDVIISDAFMPDMTGIELLEKLTTSEAGVPLFYLATGDIDISEDALIAKGAKGLIEKPYSLDDLVERVKKDLQA